MRSLFPSLAYFQGFEVCSVRAMVPILPSRILFQARCVPEHSYPLRRRRRGEAGHVEVFSFPLWPLPFLILRELLSFGSWAPDFFVLSGSSHSQTSFPCSPLYSRWSEDSPCLSSRGTCKGSRYFAFSSSFTPFVLRVGGSI